MQKNLQLAGTVSLTPDEIAFGKKVQSSFTFEYPDISEVGTIRPLKAENMSPGSTDVGDVSYNVPTVGFSTATWVPGTPAHSWQAIACGGTDIGVKGMIVAAKALANMGIELLHNPALIDAAKKEFAARKGNYQYKALLGDREPALNYRD
jgi:aminobenzoyl-glutamate utilization protein B